MSKMYEVSVWHKNEIMDIKEYEELEEMLINIPFMLNKFNDCTKIELATQEQNEDGENINTFVWATIDIQEYLKGEEINELL